MKMILDKSDKKLINAVGNLVEDQVVGLLRNDEKMKVVVEKAVIRYIDKLKVYIKEIIKNEIYEIIGGAEDKSSYYKRGVKYATNDWIKDQMLDIIKDKILELMSKFKIGFDEK